MYPLIWISDSIFIPTYFLVISLAYCICMLWLVVRADQRDIHRNQLLDVCLLIMVGGFVGSRLFHVIWEMPQYYWENPLDVFKVWQGGFVFYGGVVGAVAPSIYYVRKKNGKLAQWFDLFAPVAPLGYILGRFATLLSGSGYGKPTHLPWAIQYPFGSEAPAGVPLHPTPIYAMLWELFVLITVLYFERRAKVDSYWRKPGRIFLLFIVLHGLGRAGVEQFRGDFRGEDVAMLSISTWISLVLVSIGLIVLLQPVIKRKSL